MLQPQRFKNTPFKIAVFIINLLLMAVAFLLIRDKDKERIANQPNNSPDITPANEAAKSVEETIIRENDEESDDDDNTKEAVPSSSLKPSPVPDNVTTQPNPTTSTPATPKTRSS